MVEGLKERNVAQDMHATICIFNPFMLLCLDDIYESGQSLGAKSFPPPFLAPNTEAQAILRGINYASGASGIMDKTGFFFVSPIIHSLCFPFVSKK